VTHEPFELRVADTAIADLRVRLARARFPDQPPGPAWAYGADLDFMRDLVAYWQDGFDWRAAEARLNAFPNRQVDLAAVKLHFLHVPGVGPDPHPLLLLHGWPGSVLEFLDLIPRLTDPGRFGGDPADAFTVVAPSLPGFGLSFSPGQPRFSAEAIADCLAALMTDVLGYPRFGAQGGDWGAFVSARLGYAYPERLTGIHLNFLPLRRDAGLVADPTPDERRYVEELSGFLREEAGYQAIQGTRPQTLAYALTDSPVGLAAWIIEKFRAWSDCDGDLERVFTKDRLLANISLYWFSGAIGSSFWPYYARAHGPWPIPEGETVDVPTGYAAFPREILRPPRTLAARTFTKIERWTSMERGGHFAAMEQPVALAGDIRQFFRSQRYEGRKP
jgi:pimeloyl-ACP methyl ester carboxylesterase